MANRPGHQAHTAQPAVLPPPAKARQTHPQFPCTKCGELIDAEDRYCRHCGKPNGTADIWYFQTGWIILLAYTVIGPFALPLVWRSPRLNLGMRILLTVAIVVPTILVFYLLYLIGAHILRLWNELDAEMQGLRY